jgi:Ca2+-binding RTX toxin-like protein
MLEKIKKFVLKRSKLIIIFIIIALIITILLIVFKFFINNDFYSNESEVANDSKEKMSVLYQDYEKSKAKFNVYGEVAGDKVITMTLKCGDVEETVELSEDPISVDNHCILSLNSIRYGSSYLNAYIITPDASLITISSYNAPSLQVNAYKKETRVVLENGMIYNRVAKQYDSKFTIQVANNILETTEGGTMSAYTETIDAKSAYDMLFGGYTVDGSRYYEKIGTETIYGVSLFQIINGNASIKKRGTEDILDFQDYNEFAYVKTDEYESVLFDKTNKSDFLEDYLHVGEENTSFINQQEELDKDKKLDFIGLAKHDRNINRDELNERMRKYVEYYTNKINGYNNNQDDENNDNEDNTNTTDPCEFNVTMGGLHVTYVDWCRTDYKISQNTLPSGFGVDVDDFIYCMYGTTDNSYGWAEGYVYKACADTFSHETY